ncbi:MAG: LptA/OstA family protein [Alphaproteobacteria bacterium]
MRNIIFFIIKILFFLQFNFVFVNLAYSAEKKINDSIEIVADNLSINQNEKIAIFNGNVKAKEKDIIIKSDKMIAYYNNPKNKISKIEILHNITITRLDQIAKGNTGVFDINKNEIELNENVILIKGENILKGNNLIYNLNTGEAKIFDKNNNLNKQNGNQVKAIFTPNTIK